MLGPILLDGDAFLLVLNLYPRSGAWLPPSRLISGMIEGNLPR
jgi:hypothetical protein